MLGFHSISAAPISGRTTNAQTASSGDLSPYAGSKPSLASRAVRATGSAWVDLDAATAASSALSPYAQGLPSFSRRGNPRVISAGWYDPGAPVVSDDLPIRCQALPRPRATPSYSRVWVDLDSAVVASSDLSVYAQVRAIESRRLAGSRSWVDLEGAVAASSDLSAYAQSITPRVRIARPFGKGTAWVDLVDGIAPVIPPITGNVGGSGGGGAGRRRVSFEEADQIRRRMRDIEIKRFKSWKDPKRLERQLQQIYADLYESEFRTELPELPELAQTDQRAEPLATLKPDFAPLLKDLTAIRQLLDLYQIFLDDEEAIALLLLS